MEFKEKAKKACRVKNLIILCLIALFLWLGGNAVVRYWSQPLSTDISYKYAETKVGVQLPQITMCQPSFSENPIFKETHNGPFNFISTFASYIKRNKSVDLMQNLHPETENIVEMVHYWTGSKYVSLWPLVGKVWTKAFLLNAGGYSGPCYTFDLSKIKRFKYDNLKTGIGGRPGIEFVMAENNHWQTVALMLHTRLDLPDAYALNEYIVLSFSDKLKQVHVFEIQKKINKREPTRNVPCQKYEYRTCLSIEKNKAMIEKFGCSIPILYTGEHLDNFIPNNMSNCNYESTLEALDFYLNVGTNCSMTQTCENVRFKSNYKIEKTWFENKTLVYVLFKNPDVEYHQSYINYDFISLIAEVGGLLGLTLGASALTLFESLFIHVPYY